MRNSHSVQMPVRTSKGTGWLWDMSRDGGWTAPGVTSNSCKPWLSPDLSFEAHAWVFFSLITFRSCSL